MVDRKIKKLYKKKICKVLSALQDLNKGLNTEAVHDFRTQFKKFKAFHLLIHFEDKKDRIGGKIKAIYSCSGLIRNYQVQPELLNNLCKEYNIVFPSGLFQFIEFHKDALTNHLLYLYTHFSHKKLTVKLLKKLPARVSNRSIRDFAKMHISRVMQIIHQPFATDDEIHDSRKKIKNLLYLKKYLTKRMPGARFSTDEEMVINKEFSDQLGDYQDLTVSAELVNWYMINNTATATIPEGSGESVERSHLFRLLEAIESKKNSILYQIQQIPLLDSM